MCSFHFPAPRRVLPAADRFGFLTDSPHVRNVASRPHDRGGRLPAVTFVGTQMLATPAGRLGPPDHDAIQGFSQQFHVVLVGPADDKRERDASPVDQQTAFGAFFSPDPWGCCPPLPEPVALYPRSHQCSATPKRSLPDHHTRLNQPAIVGEKNLRRATVESDGEQPWHCQNSWAGPSTDNRFAAHTRSRRTRDADLTACARLRNAVDICVPGPARPGLGSTVPPGTRVHPTLPTSKLCSCRKRARAHERRKAYLGISSKNKVATAVGLWQPNRNASPGREGAKLGFKLDFDRMGCRRY